MNEATRLVTNALRFLEDSRKLSRDMARMEKKMRLDAAEMAEAHARVIAQIIEQEEMILRIVAAATEDVMTKG